MAVIDDPEKAKEIMRMYADEMVKHIASTLIIPKILMSHKTPPSLRDTKITFETLKMYQHRMASPGRRARRRRRRR